LRFNVALGPLVKKLNHLRACLGTMALRHSKDVVVVGKEVCADREHLASSNRRMWRLLFSDPPSL
jgi:hypothetical protein